MFLPLIHDLAGGLKLQGHLSGHAYVELIWLNIQNFSQLFRLRNDGEIGTKIEKAVVAAAITIFIAVY